MPCRRDDPADLFVHIQHRLADCFVWLGHCLQGVLQGVEGIIVLGVTVINADLFKVLCSCAVLAMPPRVLRRHPVFEPIAFVLQRLGFGPCGNVLRDRSLVYFHLQRRVPGVVCGCFLAPSRNRCRHVDLRKIRRDILRSLLNNSGYGD